MPALPPADDMLVDSAPQRPQLLPVHTASPRLPATAAGEKTLGEKTLGEKTLAFCLLGAGPAPTAPVACSSVR